MPAWAETARRQLAKTECVAELEELASKFGITVRCDWSRLRDVPSHIGGKRAREALLTGIVPALSRWLPTMGKPLLQRLMSELVLCEHLTRNGTEIGGLSDGERVYISLDHYGDLDTVYQRMLHHEFSSNVFKSLPWTEQAKWHDLSRGHYDTSNEYMQRCLDDFDFAYTSPPRQLRHGLLANYSATNPENDFNLYAEKLFASPEQVQQWAAEYPLVRQKLAVVKSFYRRAGWHGKFPDEG